MPIHVSFDAYINVDETRVPEFDITMDVDDHGAPRATCWIPSEAGKKFEIRCLDQRPSPRPASWHKFTVDGTHVADKILKGDQGPFGHGPMAPLMFLPDVAVEGGRRPLMFADLELTDDDDMLHANVSAELGEIRLDIKPVIVTGATPAGLGRQNSTLSVGTVHERSKKAGAHNVQLGPVISQRPREGVRTVDDGPPHVVFVFRYRPLALLQAQGIAPPPEPSQIERSPTPRSQRDNQPDLEIIVKGDDDEDEEEEERRLQAQIAKSQARLESIQKRKRSDNGVRVKAEPSSRRPRFSGPSEVIDLTIE